MAEKALTAVIQWVSFNVSTSLPSNGSRRSPT
jgi:hypothetical protein